MVYSLHSPRTKQLWLPQLAPEFMRWKKNVKERPKLYVWKQTCKGTITKQTIARGTYSLSVANVVLIRYFHWLTEYTPPKVQAQNQNVNGDCCSQRYNYHIWKTLIFRFSLMWYYSFNIRCTGIRLLNLPGCSNKRCSCSLLQELQGFAKDQGVLSFLEVTFWEIFKFLLGLKLSFLNLKWFPKADVFN